MGFRNLILSGKWSEPIVDLDKRQPVKTQVKITEQQVIRTSKDIQDWRNAIISAENVQIPDRAPLQNTYDDVMIDGHVTGIISAVKNKIKAKEFLILNDDGTEDEETTKLFQKRWFFKYLDAAVEAKFFGFSLLQLGDITDDGFPDIESIKRRHVVPEWGIVKTDLFSTVRADGFDYNDPKNINWFIFLGEPKDLGLLNVVTPHALAKKNVLSAAWQHAEVFGMPIRIGKTDIDDTNKRKSMEKMLANMGRAAWGVFDMTDELELVQGSRTDAHKVYTEPFKISNQEISKALSGSIGIFDEKSFVGSAEIGERLFQEFITSDSRNIKFDINDELLVRMAFHGMIPSGKSFEWKTEETVTTMQKAQIIKDLSPFYVIEPEEVTLQTGIKVTALKNTAAGAGAEENEAEVSSVMPAVAELYNKVLDKTE